MTPPFLFRITEMRQRNDVPEIRDRHGQWCPPRRRGYNRRRGSFNSDNRIFHCNGQTISPAFLDEQELQQPFKTISVYVDQDIFHIVNYDASENQVGDGRHQIVPDADDSESGSGESDDTTVQRNPAIYMDWARLRFEHGDENNAYASYATYAGTRSRLRTQRPGQTWARRLLPEAYHAEHRNWTPHPQYGGMNGELPLLLALVAFSVEHGHLNDAFAAAFVDGMWNMENLGQMNHGRTDRRGLLVSVYAWPQHSTSQLLEMYERGAYGTIFP